MLGLLRRHEAFRSPALWLAQSAAVSGVLLGFYAWRRYVLPTSESPLQQFLAVIWVLLAFYLLFGKVHTRCTALDLALPIPTRRLWLSHVAAVVLAGAPMVAVALGVIALLQRTLFDVAGAPLAEPSLVALTIHLAAGLVLAVVAIESVRLDLFATPGGWRPLAIRLAIVAAVGGLSVGLGAYPLPVVAVPLALAAALGAWTLRRLPESFSVAPFESPTDGPEAAGGEKWSSAATAMTPPRILHRLFLCVQGAKFGAATPWIVYPWVVLMGAIAGGFFTGWNELEDLRFLYIPLYVFLLFSPVPAAVEQLALLDPLPIGRRALFALLTLPSLVFFLLGYGAGHLGLKTLREPLELVDYRRTARGGPYCICLPAGRDEIAWDGRPPPTVSPWGESHAASHKPLFSGGRIRLYSPYHAPGESSPEFVALQLSRAVEAVYGQRIPASEIQERYLELEADEVVLKGERLTLRADYPDLEPLGRGPMLPFFLVATGLPFLLLTALFLRTYRASLSTRWGKVVWIGGAAGALGLVTLQTVLAVRNFIEPWASRGFLEILLRKAGELPAGTLAAWALAVLLVLAGYRLAESLLQRAELPARPDARWLGETAADSA